MYEIIKKSKFDLRRKFVANQLEPPSESSESFVDANVYEASIYSPRELQLRMHNTQRYQSKPNVEEELLQFKAQLHEKFKISETKDYVFPRVFPVQKTQQEASPHRFIGKQPQSNQDFHPPPLDTRTPLCENPSRQECATTVACKQTTPERVAVFSPPHQHTASHSRLQKTAQSLMTRL